MTFPGKKRLFFLTSLPLATAALLAQAAAFYFLALAVAAAVGRLWMLLYPYALFVKAQPAPAESSSWPVTVLFIGGLVLAILSLASVVISFRRRESGWRFITIILLVTYFGSWVPLLFREHL